MLYSHLFAGENQSLLLWRNALLFFDALFDTVHFVCWFDVDFNFFAGQRLYMDKKTIISIWLSG